MNLEKKKADWYENDYLLLKELYNRINILLENKQEGFEAEIKKIIFNDKFRENYKATDEFAYMTLACEISDMEQDAKRKDTILYRSSSINEVIYVIREVKILLWKIEFLEKENTLNKLIEMILENKITIEMIFVAIKVAAVDKINLGVSIAEAVFLQNKYVDAYRLLFYLDILYPGMENIITFMSYINLQLGNKKEAAELLEKIKNPSEIVEEMKNELRSK